jgi:hypothetical protein
MESLLLVSHNELLLVSSLLMTYMASNSPELTVGTGIGTKQSMSTSSGLQNAEPLSRSGAFHGYSVDDYDDSDDDDNDRIRNESHDSFGDLWHGSSSRTDSNRRRSRLSDHFTTNHSAVSESGWSEGAGSSESDLSAMTFGTLGSAIVIDATVPSRHNRPTEKPIQPQRQQEKSKGMASSSLPAVPRKLPSEEARKDLKVEREADESLVSATKSSTETDSGKAGTTSKGNEQDKSSMDEKDKEPVSPKRKKKKEVKKMNVAGLNADPGSLGETAIAEKVKKSKKKKKTEEPALISDDGELASPTPSLKKKKKKDITKVSESDKEGVDDTIESPSSKSKKTTSGKNRTTSSSSESPLVKPEKKKKKSQKSEMDINP